MGIGLRLKKKIIIIWLCSDITNLLVIVFMYSFLFVFFSLIIRDICLGANGLDYKPSLYYNPGLTCIARIACIYG